MIEFHASLVVAALAVAASPPLAHHGWSEYDQQTTLKLTGTIEEAGYEHPHGHIKLKTPARPGSPCSRRRRAWTRAACPRTC